MDFDHSKDLISPQLREHADQLVHSLLSFMSFDTPGEVSEEAWPIFFGARLIALSKIDSGVRPIAAGNTLRRLISKVISKFVLPDAVEMRVPVQVGIGVPKASDAAVCATRRFVTKNEGSDKVMIHIDAFNTLRRDHILNIAQQCFPVIFPYLWSCYASLNTPME